MTWARWGSLRDGPTGTVRFPGPGRLTKTETLSPAAPARRALPLVVPSRDTPGHSESPRPPERHMVRRLPRLDVVAAGGLTVAAAAEKGVGSLYPDEVKT